VNAAWASGLAALAWLTFASAPVEAAPLAVPPAAEVPAGPPDLLLEVHVNGRPTGELAMLRTRPDGCDALETAPLKTVRLYEGADPEACLQSIPGLAYDLDREGARIDVYAQRLAPGPQDRRADVRTYAPALTGLIGQYGLSSQRVEDRSGTHETGFADLSLTLHTGKGRLLNDSVASWDGSATEVQRLATAYELDFPDNMARLTLGDSFTRAPRWGRLAAFAGVQFGTDFSMDPDQSYRPYRTFQTLLRQQSEIDVRVNGALRERTSVAPGFSELQINPEAGLNDVEIAIRDASGLTRIEDISFFAAADGLAAGVTDYSVSAGVPRRFDGARSEYGDTLLASALVRRGLSDSITGEVHGEFGRAALTAGAGLQVATGAFGILNVSASLSETAEGARGHLLAVGLDRSARRASLQLQARMADPDYTDAAAAAGAPFPDVSLRASAGIFTPAGSFRAGYSQQDDRVLPDRRFVSAGWEKSLSDNRALISADGFHDIARGESGLTISLRINFGSYSARAGSERLGGASSAAFEVSRLRGAGERLQWTVQAVDGDRSDAAQASLQADLGAAEAFVHAGAFGSTRELSAGLRGGFTVLGRRAVFARQSTPATVRVRTPGLAGVPVYQDNRRVALTDADGIAVITGVRPFELNRLSLKPEDVPLDFEVVSFDLDFVPRRGISDVTFDFRRQSALAFSVVLADGGRCRRAAGWSLPPRAGAAPSGWMGAYSAPRRTRPIPSSSMRRTAPTLRGLARCAARAGCNSALGFNSSMRGFRDEDIAGGARLCILRGRAGARAKLFGVCNHDEFCALQCLFRPHGGRDLDGHHDLHRTVVHWRRL
jgi:outer membrane usher protein